MKRYYWDRRARGEMKARGAARSQSPNTPFRRQHREIRAEHDALPALAFHQRHEILGQTVERIGAGVDMEVAELPDHRGDFINPREPDMPADDDKLGKVEHHVFKIGNEAPGL